MLPILKTYELRYNCKSLNVTNAPAFITATDTEDVDRQMYPFLDYTIVSVKLHRLNTTE